MNELVEHFKVNIDLGKHPLLQVMSMLCSYALNLFSLYIVVYTIFYAARSGWYHL